ncbi:MAG: NTP transferase domain-containing protein [Clostridiales bacterium]|nr:NTP transferase domain-containing protein [Clostridiales bacterium]
MIALVLAAGYATRLYPLTINTPKPLLPVGPKTMIDYIVDEIETISDVHKIVVVTNHRFAGHFDEWAEKRLAEDAEKGIDLPIEIIDDGTTDDSNKLGAIGDIQFVIDKLSIDEDLMIIAGDNLFTYKLSDMYDFFKTNGKDTLVAIHVEPVEQLRKLAVAILDDDCKVLSLAEKPKEPKSHTAIYATYMYLRETLPMIRRYLDEGNTPDAPGNFPSWLYTRKDVLAYRAPGVCIDIGTPENYKDVCDNYEEILGL